jgi:hypothetical protein
VEKYGLYFKNRLKKADFLENLPVKDRKAIDFSPLA